MTSGRSIGTSRAPRLFLHKLPDGCVVDGEIVIATPRGLDFDALQMRLHPAALAPRNSRGRRPPPSSVSICSRWTGRTFDATRSWSVARSSKRCSRRQRRRSTSRRSRAIEGSRRSGSIASRARGSTASSAKPIDGQYEPGKRAMLKVKHARTADCAVAGFRWHKRGPDAVGSLLLGLYDAKGRLQHVGVTSAFTMARRRELATELAPLREHALDDHPWREWAIANGEFGRMPGGQSRWSAGKDLWEPLRVERVCEVKAIIRRIEVPARGPCSSAGGPTSAPTIAIRPARCDPYDRGSSVPGATGLDPRRSRAASGSSVLDWSHLRRNVLQVSRMRVSVEPPAHRVDENRLVRCPAARWRAFQRSRPSASSFFLPVRSRSRKFRHSSARRRTRARPAASTAAATGVPLPSRSCRADSSRRPPANRAPCRSPRVDRRSLQIFSASSAVRKSAGSHSSISSHVNGAETRRQASAAPSTAATVRSLAFRCSREHAVALFFPPLARRNRRGAAFDLSRKRERAPDPSTP